MRLIKLDATASTNDFLKALSGSQELENYTVVTAETQTKGKGQMGAAWNSESGKNLTMSVLIKNAVADATQGFNLNIAVALAVVQALEGYDIPNLAIKWPNDIMAGDKKIGGILIENSLKSDGSMVSVIGLGLNVNQTRFENLPKASSLAVVMASGFDRDLLLEQIVLNLKRNISALGDRFPELSGLYANYLFKKNIPMPFENQSKKRFMGIIQGVSDSGKLEVLLEDENTVSFSLKEIRMLY